jgi:hypothetical protein
MYTRPYTVHSYSKRKEKEKEQEEAKKNVGIFTTNSTRQEVANEIKKTHFSLGNSDAEIPQSLSKASYQNVQVDDKTISDQQKKMSKINRRSNFVLGRDQNNLGETTSNQAYNSKQLSQYKNGGTFSANTLRKGNFRLGFNQDNIYETTAQSNFTNKNAESNTLNSYAHRVDKKSSVSHLYGYGKPNYQTTNNSNFTEKDVTNSFKDKLLLKERDKNLKKANFSFGHFSNKGMTSTLPVDMTEHAKQFHADLAKQNQIAKQRGLELKKSNFKFSEKAKHDEDDGTFKSMAQLQFDEEKFKGDSTAQMNMKNKEVSENLQKDLRSAHFHFGNNKGENQSCSHNAHPKFNVDLKGMEESQKLAKKMQSAHFVLADGNTKGLPLKSTYKDTISGNANYQHVPRDTTYADSKKTTIDIGKGKCLDYTSEAKAKFTPHHGAQSLDRDTKNSLSYLKQNHFELGAGKNDFGTVNKLDYSAKPNPGYVKHHGNVQKTSFVMGFQGNPFHSNTPSGAAAASFTDRGRPVPYQRMAGDMAKATSSTKAANSMQKENFSLGKQGGEFRTMNQAYYKWIQPKADH